MYTLPIPSQTINHPNSLLTQMFFPYTKPRNSVSYITFQEHNLIEHIYKNRKRKNETTNNLIENMFNYILLNK